MSGTAVIRSILATTSAVTALVPATRIFSGHAPLNTPRPLIIVSKVGANKFKTIRVSEYPKLVIERVQVSVLDIVEANVYPVLIQVGYACPGRRGTINSFMVDSITDAGDGPEIPMPDVPLFSQSQDFFVNWVLPAP